MESLQWLCDCCSEKCKKSTFSVCYKNNCKIIKCLNFVRDEEKIVGYSEFEYNIRSDKDG